MGPTTAIATHTHTDSQDHCAQDGRDTIDTCCAPGPDIATVWTCPPPVYTRTAELCANNTNSQGHRAVCPLATHMFTKYNHRTKPGRNAATAAQTHWSQSTIWRGHTRPTTSPKKEKKGCISKEFCAKTDVRPLASPRVALVGVRLLKHPDNGNTR